MLIDARGWAKRPTTDQEGAAVFTAGLRDGADVEEALAEVKAVASCLPDQSGRVYGLPVWKKGIVIVRRAYWGPQYCGAVIPVSGDRKGEFEISIEISNKIYQADVPYTSAWWIRRVVRWVIARHRQESVQAIESA